jgi:choline dehydrogenase-like flavoprotein
MEQIYYVIGSGAAGVACAYGLLLRGKQVVMLDSGIEIDEKLRELYLYKVADLTKLQEVNFLSLSETAVVKQLKLKYSSDFCYDQVGIEFNNAGVYGSLALGGLTNVWGAAVLPFRSQDLKTWPVKFADLEAAYAKVTELFQVMAEPDDHLAHEFPLYSTAPIALKRSLKAQYLYNKMLLNKVKLTDNHIHFGYSRLAFNRNGAHPEGCVYCGLCFYGCPTNQIFCSADCLVRLAKFPNFQYRKAVLVEKFVEQADKIIIHAQDMKTPGRSRYEVDPPNIN